MGLPTNVAASVVGIGSYSNHSYNRENTGIATGRSISADGSDLDRDVSRHQVQGLFSSRAAGNKQRNEKSNGGIELKGLWRQRKTR